MWLEQSFPSLQVTFKVWDHTKLWTVSGVSSRDRLVVRTLRCGRSNPGSNPGHGSDILKKLLTFTPNFPNMDPYWYLPCIEASVV